MMTRSDIESLYSNTCTERSDSVEISGWKGILISDKHIGSIFGHGFSFIDGKGITW
jgi:hypothetical protein